MDLVKVGKTLKSFGVKGLLKIKIKDAFVDDISDTDVLFIDCNDGKIPYFIQKVDLDAATVSLEEVNSNEAASKLAMSDIFLKSNDVTIKSDTSEESSFEKLLGFMIIDNDKIIGTITDIIEYPQQLMASVSLDDLTVLIPLNEAFITTIDTNTRKVICDLPEGLVETQIH